MERLIRPRNDSLGLLFHFTRKHAISKGTDFKSVPNTVQARFKKFYDASLLEIGNINLKMVISIQLSTLSPGNQRHYRKWYLHRFGE